MTLIFANFFFLQAVGLSERQFNDLMTVPHTFFYLRVRKDSSLDPKAGTMHRKSKENVLHSKSTGLLPTIRDSEHGFDETKYSPGSDGIKDHNQNQSSTLSMGQQGRYQTPEQSKSAKTLFSSQSTGGLINSRSNLSVGLASDDSQGIKKLAWTGKVPARGIPTKKLLINSMSSLSVNTLVATKVQSHAKQNDQQKVNDNTSFISDNESIPQATMNNLKEAMERSAGVGGSVYDLEVATQDTIDLNFYFTLSKEGVTQYSHKSSQFTSLAQWHREYLLFHRISSIRFFKLYKRWKAFSVWKRGLRGGKMQVAGAALDKNLFLFNPPLRNALLTVRQLSAPLSTMGMLSLPPGEIFDMEDFIQAQSEGTEQYHDSLYSDIISQFSLTEKYTESTISHDAL